MSVFSGSRYGSRLSPLNIPSRKPSFSSTSKESCIQGPPLHPYYQSLSLSLQAKFGDLDEDGNYAAAEDAVLSPGCLNFVVDFGNDGAYVGVDIGLTKEDDIEGFLGPVDGGGRPRGLRTRWICILGPHRQPELVQAIGNRYGLSPRHISLLLSQPPDSVELPQVPHQSRLRRAGQKMAESLSSARKSMEKANIDNLQDPESIELAGLDADSLSSINKDTHTIANLNTSYMALVAKVWHWHAVEWGGRFLCVGYNSIHNLPPSQDTVSGKWDNVGSYSSKDISGTWSSFGVTTAEAGASEDGGGDTGDNYPEGRRLWTWLILCDDGTIISLHEPLSHRTALTPYEYQVQINVIRRNTLTIFRSLSRAPEAINRTSMEKSKGIGALDELPFRMHRADLTESEPSLLFYYLFDDWYSSWSLAIERQHPYKKKLRQLRTDLIRDPELSHVNDLLSLARQLGTLKRMYETYQLIIDRMLYRQENSLSMAKGGGKVIITGGSDKMVASAQASISPGGARSPESVVMGDPKILGVPLSSHSVARFERLRDRIKLYALAELQDCLDEKDGLVNMTFQLIAFKQTSAVEKMTRVAILFAGATILFLPLTLLTGFFSMDIQGMKNSWRPVHFWGASGVSIIITVCLLIGVVKYSVAVDTVRLGAQKARAMGQAQCWWGKKKSS